MPAQSPLLSRRQYLAAMAVAGLMPASSLFAQADNPMRGVFMILSTPYLDSGELDHQSLGGQAGFCKRCGVDALVWPQNSSEQSYLSPAERMAGFETLAAASREQNIPLILGVQADDTAGMVEYARLAESLSPAGMIAIPPTTATSLDEIYRYYETLCGITSRPVFVQTSGGPDIELTVDFLVRLARDFPQCGYIKEEYGNVQQRMVELARHRPDPIRSIIGATFGLGWLYEMRLGSDGVMTGGVMYGDVYASLWRLHQENRLEELRECYAALLLMLNLDSLIPGVRLYVLQKRGIFATTRSRRGNYSFTPTQIAEIEFRLAALAPWLRS